MTAPQEIVERALAASTSRDCIVLVQARSIANLRWARSTLTMNGETFGTTVTVIAIVDVEGGVASGSVTVSAPSLESLPGLVRRAALMAREGGPAEVFAPAELWGPAGRSPPNPPGGSQAPQRTSAVSMIISPTAFGR